ncbi:hypothetical protein AB6A40_008231 [Gnathostoma spinigerum]|uniref:MSP domain-containing protein n=1 Tax=Gnathostoma spinigerum TaxID=75299 RepID=A0ABD6EQU6_9BILA
MDNTLLAQILMRAKNERRARRQNRQISFTFNKPILCQSAYSAGKSDVMKRNTVARCGGDKEERSMVNSLENSVFQKTNRVPSSHQHLDLFGSEQKPCRSNSIHADLTPKVIDKPSVNLQQKQSDAQLPFCPSGAVSLQSAHSSISANNKQNWTHSSSTFSVASSSRTASSQLHRNNVLTCSVRCLYFGFVELKERAYRSVKLHNISQEKLSLKIFVRSKGKGFELSEDGLVVINAGERHVIRVIFEPKIAARYLNDLKISVLNAEHLSYTIPIFGGGGVASLRLISERNLDIARDGSYVLSTSNSACFTFEALNNGIRDAFIFVMVIDNETDKVVETVHVEPSDAVVLIHRRKQKFVVSISIDEDDHRKRANSVASVRSTDSCPTQTLSRSSSCRYRVLLLWGEEAQRRRLQKYELLHNKNFLFLERTLTKIAFVHEEEARCPNPRATDYAVGPYDYDVFNESLRRTCISVVNNRLSFSTSNVSVRDATLSEFALQPDATILPTYEKTVLIDVTHDYDSRRH